MVAMNPPSALAETVHDAKSVVVVTGAGMSADSGIPTFRDALTGLWAKYDPMQLATPEAFAADPETVSRWYDQRRRDVLQCEPHAGHVALAQWQRHVTQRGGAFTLLTQNVDDLHERVGSQEVHHLHGSLFVWRCTGTGDTLPFNQPDPFDRYPPISPAGHPMRPCVVWFGELLPEDVMRTSADALARCDLFVSVGTSGVVQPVASFIHDANAAGARTVEINPDPTPISEYFDHNLRDRAVEALPRLLD